MYHRKFQQGDLVKYTGEKLKELNGKIGSICGRIAGTDTGVVVDFGEDQAFVMSEGVLAKTVAKPKAEDVEVEKRKMPDVQKRKGVGKRQKNAE
jgi:hypothetical protein